MSSGRSSLFKIILIIAIVLITAGGFRWLMSSRPSQPARAPQESEWPVKVETLKRSDNVPVITLFGRVESPHATQLVSAINADVLSVPVKEAQRVTKDQLLIQLDDQDARLALQQREADLQEAKASLENERVQHENNLQVLQLEKEVLALAQNELDRTLKLKQTQVTSQSVIDTAKQAVVNQQISIAQRELAIASHAANELRLSAAVEKTRAQRDLARLDVKRSKVVSPFAAVITKLSAVPGMRVRSGDALVDLFENNLLEVRAQVPAVYLPVLRTALHAGRNMTARIANLNSVSQESMTLQKQILITLDRIAGDIKTGQSSVDAYFKLENSDDNLAEGQILKLRLSLPALENSFTVSAEAIYGDNRIYTVKDNRLQSHIVQRLGLMYDAMDKERIILDDPELTENTQILSTQLPNAIDGLKVKILP